jgi:hypothetical protein
LPDSLVCLLDPEGDGDAVFCTVTRESRIKSENGNRKDKIIPSLQTEDRYRVKARLSLVSSHNLYDIRLVLRHFTLRNTAKSECALIEFPGILLPAFEPVLKALQAMKERGDLPFADLIVPPVMFNPGDEAVPAGLPAYARARRFRFNLRKATEAPELDLFLDPTRAVDTSELENRSTLDKA